MTPPLPLAELVKKWRDEADGVTAMGYSQQGDRMRDCADELEAALPLGRCETCREWQPIDSAPMDGTRVLVRHRDTTYIASWGVAFIGDIRRATKSGWETDCGQDLQPTHWQPLPAPPAAGEETR